MSSGGGAFSPEEIRYLKSLPAVAEVTSRRITYTDDFKRYCLCRYAEGESPVRMFREAGLDPALIGHKRIERCIARWRESRDEILNDGHAVLSPLDNPSERGGGIGASFEGGMEPPVGMDPSADFSVNPTMDPAMDSAMDPTMDSLADSSADRSGSAGRDGRAGRSGSTDRSGRADRTDRSARTPQGGRGAQDGVDDIRILPERRAIVFSPSKKDREDDLRNLLITQQVRRIDDLERQVDMLKALLRTNQRRSMAQKPIRTPSQGSSDEDVANSGKQ